MAIFRKIHVSFWRDTFVESLTPEQKFFYLYLLTNSQTRQCGIYEIGKRMIAYDTGYNIDTVSKLLEYFISVDKIRYNEEKSEIAIKNWDKYNGSTSPKIQSCINEELSYVKDDKMIEYVYGMDRVSILHRNRTEQNRTEKKDFSPSGNEQPVSTKTRKKGGAGELPIGMV